MYMHICTHKPTHIHTGLCINVICMYKYISGYLPYSTYTTVLSVSNPAILSALHWKTSSLLASVIVIVETFPLVESGDPLRNH